MKNQYKKQISEFTEGHLDEMIADICELVSIPSARSDPEKDMPYGLGPFTALRTAEALMERKGLSVTDYGNRIAAGDMTELEPGLDILAHLDVVPCENNWTVCDPYSPVRVGNRLYGRGTIDDKGPAIAALYAMQCVRELGIPLKRNVRLLLGTDEECGSSDVEYYYERTDEAPMTFTPDANFPLINLEKGRYAGLTEAFPKNAVQGPRIRSISAGVKINVIPESACVVLEGISQDAVSRCMEETANATKASFTADENSGMITVTAHGVGGHAAYPETSNNALTALLHLITLLPLEQCELTSLLGSLSELFPHGDYFGNAIHIAMEDQVSGYLTCSADILNYREGKLSFCFDARCPVCANEDNVKRRAVDVMSRLGLTVLEAPMVMPHYVSENSDFVRTLLHVYSDWTGEKGRALSTGGGTYVHELKNGVAFGCEIEGLDNHLHGADEFIDIDQLKLSVCMFASAIIELCA